MSGTWKLMTVLLLVGCFVSTSTAAMVTAFEDDFDDGDLAGWSNPSGYWTNPDSYAELPQTAPNPVDGLQPLSTTFTEVTPLNGEFVFEFDFQYLDTTATTRNQWKVDLLDAAGLNGYRIYRSRKTSANPAVELFSITSGVETSLAEMGDSTNPAANLGAGVCQLSRAADGESLTLKFIHNDTDYDVLTASDNTHNDFGLISLQGRYYPSTSYAFGFTFDDVELQVAVPEPTSMALISMGAGVLLLRKRKR